MTLSQRIKSQLIADLNRSDEPSVAELNSALRLLAKWRSLLIQNTVLANCGTEVLQGPLVGLDFVEKSAEGCHVAKLLGTYEQPLHETISSIIGKGYSAILNIGCAEGYYAVGLALKMPGVLSLAFDTDIAAQKACRQLAAKNGVADRVTVSGEFNINDFDNYSDKEVLVWCDIEGAEDILLNPHKAPALRGMDIVVESHECLNHGVTQRLLDRFSDTHKIDIVNDSGDRAIDSLPDWFNQLPHLDQLLAVWEWRSGPTPWLIMNSKVKD